MENDSSGDNGQWKPASGNNIIQYEYEFVNKNKNILNRERAPKRTFTIENPGNYKGQLGAVASNLFANTENVFVVNGFVNKADGNFELDFRIIRVEDYGISFGSFPGSEQDVI